MSTTVVDENILKQKVQKWIISISSIILIGKFAAYFLTNSVGILTDALESIVNVIAGIVSLYSLRWAAIPKDKTHPFGHGKMELVSASMEGIMIAGAGGLIIFKGIERLITHAEIQELDVGIYIVVISGILNYLMGWYSVKIGRKYNSMALVAGGKHLQSDTYSTIGLVIGLILLYFTGWLWIDSVLALIFGLIIILTGISILRKTIANLLDKADNDILNEVAETINNNREKEWVDIHNTKIIKSGNFLYIDCDLTIPWFYTLHEGHRSCDKLNRILQEKFYNRIQLNIHMDPCDIFNRSKCNHCQLPDCPHRKQAFEKIELINLKNLTEIEKEQTD